MKYFQFDVFCGIIFFVNKHFISTLETKMVVKSSKYSFKRHANRKIFLMGMKDGIPIALGYLAVSFSLGIAAKKAGLTAFQGWLTSILCNASAGEYVGFTLITAEAIYL